MPRIRTVSAAFLLALCAATAPAFAQDAVPGEWAVMAPLPDKRSEVSVATDGQSLFLLGGLSLAPDNSPWAPVEVYAYDPQTDSWSYLTDLAEGVNHAGLAYLDGALYLIGGYRGATFGPTDAVRIFDLATGEWRDGAPLPTIRGALTVVAANGLIHAIGGEAGGTRSGAHEVYDPATDSWTAAPDLPTPRDHLAAALVGNDIVVLAGRNGATMTMANNEIYSLETGTWRTGAPVPTGRSGVAAAVLDGRVYLFGGETSDTTFDEAERYDPVTDSWATLPPMPTARHGLGAATVGDRIYVVSGGPEAGYFLSDLNERLEPQ